MLGTINFDANASYGLLPQVKEGLERLGFDHLNPSSVHSGGQKAKALVEEAKTQILKFACLDAKTYDVVFTSGATEANNTAIFSVAEKYLNQTSRQNIHFLTSAVEHPSVLAPMRRLRSLGFTVNEEVFGRDPSVLGPAVFASVMLANNETGEIFDLKGLMSELKTNSPQLVFHSDCVQALGKLNLDFSSFGFDMLTFSGHKLGALPGVGALVFRRSLELIPLILGGAQQKGYRAGTENVLGIASFGLAAASLGAKLQERVREFQKRKEILRTILTAGVSQIEFNAEVGNSLPNTLSVWIKGVHADDLVVALDLDGILVSSGSACSSGRPEPSHVLLALGQTEKRVKETIRISLTAEVPVSQLEAAGQRIVDRVIMMRDSCAKGIGYERR